MCIGRIRLFETEIYTKIDENTIRFSRAESRIGSFIKSTLSEINPIYIVLMKEIRLIFETLEFMYYLTRLSAQAELYRIVSP
jgi:hypothetical protein